jgi:hypothetical protein
MRHAPLQPLLVHRQTFSPGNAFPGPIVGLPDPHLKAESLKLVITGLLPFIIRHRLDSRSSVLEY